VKVQIVSDLSGLKCMREEWKALSANFNSPLMTYEWSAACADAFCSGNNRLTMFVIRSNGVLRGIAPMITIHRACIPQLEMLGVKLGEPSGFLYSDDEALTMLLQAILTFRRPFVLSRFGINSPEVRLLNELRPKFSVCVNWNGGASPWVPMKNNWKELEAGISSGRRSDLRRYRRRAERRGQVEFQVVRPDPDSFMPHLKEIFRVEASGWKGQGGSAILNSPQSERFFSQYARAASKLGILRLFFLRIGNKTAAVRMAVEYGNRLWDLKIGYDPSFSECSPGILLTHETLRYASHEGLEAHEFLGRAEPWESIWTSEANHYLSPRVYPLSFNGSLSIAQDTVRLAIRKASVIVGARKHRGG
jgi:CelD/BcsL family acetyltransferase involved in cellulose biosynthesis